MKKVILVLLFIPFPAFAQIVDNFESGPDRWIQNDPARWKPDTLSAISGEYSYHHTFDNAEAGIDQSVIETKNLHADEGTTRWSFAIRHGYDPSSSNNWMVFLMSESISGKMLAGNKGFAIGVNITGSDDSLRLVKFTGQETVSVLNCGINWQSSVGPTNAARITAERSAKGYWKVEVYRMNGELIGSAAASDTMLYSPAYFGIVYRYSSTKDRLLWIDDVMIDGVFYEDKEPPVVDTCIVTGRNSVKISFNEPPAARSVHPGNFVINDSDTAVLLRMITPSLISVAFRDVFINKQLNTLTITNVCDKYSNCSFNLKVAFNIVWAETGDIVITEIMADPATPVALPTSEFIEITNRTGYEFNLCKWMVEDESQRYMLPDSVIHPHQILILLRQSDAGSFRKYGAVTGLKSFPSLSDDGELIILSDSTGTLIHGIHYYKEWYGNELKSEGGWSLEMIDQDYPFYYHANWTASVSRQGGTPGAENSVKKKNPDLSFQGLLNAFAEDSLNILLSFSEPVVNADRILLNAKVPENSVLKTISTDPLSEIFRVELNEPLKKRTVCEIELPDDLTDFAGNKIEKRRFSVSVTESCAKGDVLFNEMLFNPLPGGADFIELYNNSDKALDASRLYIVSINDATGDTSGLYKVSSDSRCILPHSYYALTDDHGKVEERYPGGNNELIFQAGDMPALSDDQGHLLLLNRELDIIDEVYYDEKMHYSLLQDVEGVSLEKISPGLSSSEPSSWHSASESAGWGTPGTVNSVFSETPGSENQVILSSTRITPDSDGFEDALTIFLNFADVGNVVSASIFDESGSFVKKISTNILSGKEGALFWDGTADDGKPVHNGIYIILITYFNESGQTGKWKKVCTVIR